MFAAKLRAERVAAGLTQAELAANAGMDRSYYNGVEQGEKSPTIDKVFAIAAALGVDEALLFMYDDGAASSDQLPGRDG